MATIKITVEIEVTEAGGNSESFAILGWPKMGGNPRFFHHYVRRELETISEQMESQVVHRYGSI